MARFQVGQRVRATRTVTEGGFGFPGDPEAKFPDSDYIHATEGDLGTVAYVQTIPAVPETEDGPAVDSFTTMLVRFDRTGTAVTTTDDAGEVEPLN